MEGLLMKYFVLNPGSKFKGDPYAFASREAMKTYASAVSIIDPLLSTELTEWVKIEKEKHDVMTNTDPDIIKS